MTWRHLDSVRVRFQLSPLTLGMNMDFIIMTEEKRKLIDLLNGDIAILEAQIKNNIRYIEANEKLMNEKQEIVNTLMGLPVSKQFMADDTKSELVSISKLLIQAQKLQVSNQQQDNRPPINQGDTP